MKNNKHFAFLNTPKFGWDSIQKYFDTNETEKKLLKGSIEPTSGTSNYSLVELLQSYYESTALADTVILKTHEKTVKNEINEEKNRRHQAYTALDYFLSNNTYFDYFSYDAFSILKNTVHLMTKYKKEKVTSDILMISFYSFDSELTKILTEFEITLEQIEKYVTLTEKPTSVKNKYLQNLELTLTNQQQKVSQTLKPLVNFISLYIFKNEETNGENELEKMEYSKELSKLFEKTIENALRYKTPIITPEMLFLNFIDDEQLKASKILKRVVKNPIQLTLLRYRILKLIHQDESNLRSLIPKNQYFFAYLLKTELANTDFQKLIKSNRLDKAVNMFRNQLISSAMHLNLSDVLEEELIMASKLNQNRTYSI